MELTWIDDFLMLDHTRNFTRAAVLRHTTQSAYSRRIARLEDWLGCRLFKRDTRPVELTAEGLAFRVRAERLRADILDARRAVQALASHYAQAVRIYTTNTIAIGFFPDWVRQKDLQHYSLAIASVTGCLEALSAGRAEWAIIPVFKGDPLPESCQVEMIGADCLTLMARPEIAARVTLARGLLQGPVMMYAPGTRYGAAIAEQMEAASARLAAPPLCESASAEALVAQARAGAGAAWLPEKIAPPDLKVCSAGAKLKVPYDIALVSLRGD